MPNFSTFQTSYSAIQDPELKKLVDHVADTLKTSIYQATYNNSLSKPTKFAKLKVGGKKQIEYDSVGEVVGQWLTKKKPEQIKSFTENFGLRSFMAKTAFANTTFKAVDIKSKNYVLSQIDLKSNFGYINDKLMFDRLGSLFGVDKSSTSTTTTANTQNLSLKLNLKQVKCIDETDPEWGGKDDIHAGGVAVDDKQVETKISEFAVGKFNDNDVKNFNPVKILKEFPLDSINPSTFTAFLTLAEKDAGGFSDFLSKLYEAIKADLSIILAAVGAAAGAAIGAAIGGSVGTAIAGPLGTIIGVVAGLILGALIGWLASVLQDDVFQPTITSITLNSNTAFTGPLQTLNFQDFGGTYTATVFWSVS